MKASVLIPYFQGRRRLLERTLWLLRHQTHPCEVWVLDDGSDEAIEDLCGGSVIYERVRPPGSPPRASNMAWHVGYARCQGEFIILTHPEYMAPTNGVELLIQHYEAIGGAGRLGPTAYALSPSTTERLDDWPWQEELDVLQQAPNFWAFRTPWGWSNWDAKEWHHHFAFTGQTRAAWDLTNFIPQVEERGMNDSWMVVREAEMGRPPLAAGFAVYHQHHERTTEWPFQPKSARVDRIARSA